MKWGIGEDFDDKMHRQESWHPWFAWHPVRVSGNQMRWMETVERRGLFTPCQSSYRSGGGYYVMWDYRPCGG